MKLRNLLIAAPLLLLAACDSDEGNSADPDADSGQDAGPEPDGPEPDGPPPEAEGIAAARAAGDGLVDIDIVDATVTYIKPALGTDSSGFFLQEEAAGPAIFVAVGADTLEPPLVTGDVISLTVTRMAGLATLRQAEAISDYSRTSQGGDLGALTQEISAASDLVSALGDYESELVSVSITVSGDFAGAGIDHLAGAVETAGLSGDANLRFRVPSLIQDRLGFVPTCTTEVFRTPLWRFNEVAQISAWTEDDFANTSCPAPTINQATPLNQASLRLEMVRAIDADTITNAATQFTVDNGLSVNGATVEGKIISLEVAGMTEGVTYTIAVAGSVLDVLGGAFTAGTNTAQFVGLGITETDCSDGLDDDLDTFVDCLDLNCSGDAACDYLAQPYLWEVDTDQSGEDTQEFVEILNKGPTIDLAASGYYLLLLNGSASGDTVYNAFALTGSLGAGAVFVAGSDAEAVGSTQELGTSSILQNGQDGVLLVRCPTCTTAGTDFPNGTDVGDLPTFQSEGGQTATKMDALAYDTNSTDDAGLMSALGVTAQFNESGGGNVNAESNNRSSLGGWSLRVANPNISGQQDP